MCKAVLVATTITASSASAAAAATASLGDFDNLQPDQLNLGAAILQHLLSCGQHLILDNEITSRDNKPHASSPCFSPLQVSWDGSAFVNNTLTEYSHDLP